MRSLLAAVLVTSSAAHAYELKRDSTGEVVSWKTPLHFVIDHPLASRLEAEGAPGAVRAALKTVTDAVPGLSLSASPGKARGVGYDFDHPETSTSDVLAPEEWKWNVDAVAITVVTLSRSTHQILEADIAFNAPNTRFEVIGSGQSGGRDGYDVQNAMTHELGHALGLAHNDLPQTVMFPRSVPGEISKRALAEDDLEGLRFLYERAVAADEVEVRGCSTTGAAPLVLAALMLGVLGVRRRQALALAVVVGAVAFAAPVFASGAAVQHAWTVSAVTTLPPGAGPAVLESLVTFTRGAERQTRRIPGGRWGDVEQIVEGAAVPALGERFEVLHP